MRKLSTFAGTPFDDAKISMSELVAFTTDSLQRMVSNNPNGTDLSARIAVTTTVLGGVEDAFSADLTNLGIRKSRKQIKDTYRADAVKEGEAIVGGVVLEVGSESPIINEIVPQGRTVFSSARDDQLANHFTVMLNGVTANQAALGAIGATLVQRATDLHDNWVTIYNASEASTGEKTATEQEKRDARLALQWELYENLNEITSIFPRQPDKVELYMRQSLLGFPVDSTPDGGGGDPDPDPDPEESSSSSSDFESSSSSEPEPPLSSSSSSSSSSSFFSSSSSSGP